jgi:hypothetical protein
MTKVKSCTLQFSEMFSRFMAYLVQMMIIFWGFTPHSEFDLFHFREIFCIHTLFGSDSGGCRNDLEQQNVLIIWEGLREFWPFTVMEGARRDRFCNKPMRVESCNLNIWPFLKAKTSRSFENSVAFNV